MNSKQYKKAASKQQMSQVGTVVTEESRKSLTKSQPDLRGLPTDIKRLSGTPLSHTYALASPRPKTTSGHISLRKKSQEDVETLLQNNPPSRPRSSLCPYQPLPSIGKQEAERPVLVRQGTYEVLEPRFKTKPTVSDEEKDGKVNGEECDGENGDYSDNDCAKSEDSYTSETDDNGNMPSDSARNSDNDGDENHIKERVETNHDDLARGDDLTSNNKSEESIKYSEDDMWNGEYSESGDYEYNNESENYHISVIVPSGDKIDFNLSSMDRVGEIVNNSAKQVSTDLSRCRPTLGGEDIILTDLNQTLYDAGIRDQTLVYLQFIPGETKG